MKVLISSFAWKYQILENIRPWLLHGDHWQQLPWFDRSCPPQLWPHHPLLSHTRHASWFMSPAWPLPSFFPSNFFLNLYIWLHQVLVAVLRILSFSMWDPVPWPGIEPRSSASGAQILSHWSTGEFLGNWFLTVRVLMCSTLWVLAGRGWKCLSWF